MLLVISVHSCFRCEAAYYFPKDFDVCHAGAAPSASAEREEEQEETQLSVGGRREDLERRSLDAATPGNEEKGGRQVEVEAARSGRELEGGGGEGTLVLHVRSGDIFDDKVLAYYGQVYTGYEPRLTHTKYQYVLM